MMTQDQVFKAMCAEERKRPMMRFRTDLTEHDKRAVLAMLPREPFLWALGDNGTHLIRKGADARIIDSVRECFADVAFFAFDGVSLRHLPTNDQVQQFLTRMNFRCDLCGQDAEEVNQRADLPCQSDPSRCVFLCNRCNSAN